MRHWLLKTEPDSFSWQDLVAAGRAGETWDGVRNHQAARYLSEMARGDRAFIYHTGRERRVIGTAEVMRASFPDPSDADGVFVAVVVRALAAFPAPVALATIKAEPALAECPLVRQSRLSVMPISAAHWHHIERLGRG